MNYEEDYERIVKKAKHIYNTTSSMNVKVQLELIFGNTLKQSNINMQTSTKTKLWAAKDKNAYTVWLYKTKPTLNNDTFYDVTSLGCVDAELIPQITFENSPQEIELWIYEDNYKSQLDAQYQQGLEDGRKEQKPTEWSEEDEKMLSGIIARGCNQIPYTEPGLRGEQIDWLKSLPERFNTQPKAEWSEEDEIYLQDALWCVKQASKVAREENNMGACWSAERWLKNRFKSLSPQPHWKPSEEQIRALVAFIGLINPDSRYDAVLSLLNDLKKL